MTKNNKKFLIISFITLSIIIYILAQSIYFAPTDEIIILNTKSESTIPTINNFNSKLIIPSLRIDAKIQNVGITKKGNMSTPNNFFDVGLFKYGPNPGEKGSAIIDGHVNNGLGLKAVFGNLENIKIGDDIYVEMKEGYKIHFKVTGTSLYNYNAPADSVFNQKDNSYLKLITCSGTWIPEFRTHDKRLVVTAIKLEI
jgi:LPXTG-site transpeptidase (sortase) family protein